MAVTLTLAFFGYAEWVEGVGIGVAIFLATFVATYSEFVLFTFVPSSCSSSPSSSVLPAGSRTKNLFKSCRKKHPRANVLSFEDQNLVQLRSPYLFADLIDVGHVEAISVDDLVVGDLVLLEAGDKVPADGQLLTNHLIVRHRHRYTRY